MVAAAGAAAVAIGPLIGGIATTYFSWRWVFAGEVVIVIVILIVGRRIADAPAEERPRLDVVGAVLSAVGLALIVFGVLRAGEWGWVQAKEGGPSWAGLSPTVWLVIAGFFALWVFHRWQIRRVSRNEEPLVRPGMLKNRQLSGGLTMFFFQYLVQAGFFFVVPLFLSVCLGLTALATGVRLLPLSITLLVAALGIPRFLPNISPRLVVRTGLLSLFAGTLVLLAGLDADAGPEIVFVPMLLIGLGIGALASQLGAVTVSAVPDDESPEVGGLQNTATNLGASLGTALAGSLMIATLTTSFVANIQESPAIPPNVKSQAEVQLVGGVPFISDADLEAALDGGASRPGDHRRCAGRLRRRAPRRAPCRARDSRRARPGGPDLLPAHSVEAAGRWWRARARLVTPAVRARSVETPVPHSRCDERVRAPAAGAVLGALVRVVVRAPRGLGSDGPRRPGLRLVKLVVEVRAHLGTPLFSTPFQHRTPPERAHGGT